MEDIKSLCSHVVENFSPTLDKITYVQTFKALKLRYVTSRIELNPFIEFANNSGMTNTKID